MTTANLKIFISWSGTLAKEITNVLREWLPKMFDNVDPWASDIDIVAGMPGFEEIRKALDASEFGIIVITTENMEKPLAELRGRCLIEATRRQPGPGCAALGQL